MLEKVGLLQQTVIHLKPRQVFSRLALIFRKQFFHKLRPLVEWWYVRKAGQENRQLAIRRLDFGSRDAHYLLGREDRLAVNWSRQEYTFTFLNKSRSFFGEIDWQLPDSTLLWRYNLHYFDYVYDLGVDYLKSNDEELYECFKALIVDWHENNPVAGTIGWDPYPTSLRIVNWIKAYHFFESLVNQDATFRSLFLKFLYTQVLFLENNIEYHLLNNHVIENGRALLLAGLFFQGKDARRWYTRGVNILWQELRRQICEDGGQFERSPMYHAAVLLVYAEVATVLGNRDIEVPHWVTEKIKKMAQYLALMCHPDGEIAFLNDAALGMVPTAQDILKAISLLGYGSDWEQSRPSSGLIPLSETGYYLMCHSDPDDYLIFDCGKLGPDYQPGHGHCDTLSYEWSFRGKRIVVDSGVDDYYRQDNWRSYYRSTRAHNTIVIDGQEQSEIWDNFRVGRRAHPLPVDWHTDDRITTVCGGHNGYQHLPGKVLHYRSIALLEGTILIVFDRIFGSKIHHIESFVHFHPMFELTPDQNRIKILGDSMTFSLLPFGPNIDLEILRGCESPLQGWYAPEFGQRFDNGVASISWKGELPFKFGYCLVPNLEKPSLHWETSENGYVLQLQSTEKSWVVKCSDSISLVE